MGWSALTVRPFRLVTCPAAAVALCLYEEDLLGPVAQGCPLWGRGVLHPLCCFACWLLGSTLSRHLRGRGLVMLSCAAVVALGARVFVHCSCSSCCVHRPCGGVAVVGPQGLHGRVGTLRACHGIVWFLRPAAFGWPLVLSRGAVCVLEPLVMLYLDAGARGVLCEGREHSCCCTVCAEQL